MKLDCSTVVKYSCGSVGTFLFIKSSHCLIENGQKVLTIEAVPQLNPTQVSLQSQVFTYWLSVPLWQIVTSFTNLQQKRKALLSLACFLATKKNLLGAGLF